MQGYRTIRVIRMTLKINFIKIYSNLNIYDDIRIFMLTSIHSFFFFLQYNIFLKRVSLRDKRSLIFE